MVIIVFGLPGSGKSSFASGLARRLHYRYFESNRTGREADTRAKHVELLTQMREAIRHKMDIVLCGTGERGVAGWAREAGWGTEAGSGGGGVVFIEIRADVGIGSADVGIGAGEGSESPREVMEDPHLVLYSSGNNTEILIDIAYDHLHLKQGRRMG